MLRDWLRVLRPGGALRLATSSIKGAVALYLEPERFDALNAAMKRDVRTRGVFLNQFFRSFGHRFLYDEETLTKSLREIGFADITTRPVSESPTPEFQGLETRFCDQNSFLVSLCVEARKPLETAA